MPGGGRSDSRLVTYVGVAVALVALVGSVLFDWSYSGADPLPFLVGAVVAAVGVGWHLFGGD